MKRLSFLLTLAFMLSYPTFSHAIHFGIEGGSSMAQNDIKPSTGLTMTQKSGGAGGIFFDIPLGTHFSIGPEFLYVQKGTQINLLGIDAKYLFDYIDIPVLLKARIGGQSFGLTLFGGVAYGYLVGAKASALGVDADVKDQMKKSDLSAHMGAALGLMIGKSTELFLSGRYIMGLQDVEDDTDTVNTYTKNNAIVSLFGLKFNFGKN